MTARKKPIRTILKSAKKNVRTASPVTAPDGKLTLVPGEEKKSLKRFTGRQLVRIDPAMSIPEIRRKAKALGLEMVAFDGAAGNPEGGLHQGLQSYDGVLFERLKIAVVRETAAIRLEKIMSLPRSPFLSVEPERYLRINQPGAKGKGTKGPFKDTAGATWGIHAINITASQFNGKGVKVAILDTGCDLTHPDLGGRTLHRRSFVGTRNANDKEGHGTHCTGIVGGGRKTISGTRYGVAAGARLHIGKILDDEGEGTDGQALAGIEWALEKGCRVISMSFGAPVEEGHGYSDSFEQVARIAMANNCLLIAATGNESDRSEGWVGTVNHPANCPSIIAVGALTPSLEVSDYSCAGKGLQDGQVDIAAPGDNILSAKCGGGYRRQSGTSMATAFVAGIAALLWEQYPDATAAEIWLKLAQQARRLALPATEVGAGLVYVR